MRLQRLALIAAVLSVALSCTDKNISREFTELETQQIDSVDYNYIKTTFSFWEVRAAPEYLGGLSPKYKFAIAYAECGSTANCRESEWISGGFICVCRNIVIKSAGEYKVIGNRYELRDSFSPIESRAEALSYAILMTRLYPVFDESYFKKEYRYFGGKPGTTVVQEFEDHYLVQLFDYKTFGCDHPYFSVLVRVDKNGNVSERSRRKVFEDPADSALCID